MILGCMIVLTLLAVAYAAVTSLSKPRWLLVAYVVLCPLMHLTHSYMSASNYLGLGWEWSFLDIFLLSLVVIVWPTSARAPYRPSASRFDICMMILAFLVALAYVVGFAMFASMGPLNVGRRCMFLPVYFVAVRLLQDRANVEFLFKGVRLVIPLVFLFHLLVAFRFITPPIDVNLASQGNFDFLRVEGVVDPMIYLAGIAITLTNLLYRRPGTFANAAVLTMSLIGILLTQTRSQYLAAALIVLASFALLKGRVRLMLAGGLALAAIYVLVTLLSVDIFYRFEGNRVDNTSEGYFGGWRGQEYGSLANAFASGPQYSLTGRGFGAWHPVPYAKLGYATFFHNEYLNVLSSQGLVGLVCHIILLVSAFLAGKKYCKDESIGYLMAPGTLLFLAAMPVSTFIGYIWHPAFGPTMMCFFAIARNSDIIAEKAYELEGYYDPQYQPGLTPG